MNEINMNISSSDIPTISTEFFYFSPNLLDNNIHAIDNQTLSLLQFNHQWIFSLFILSLIGILLTIIISFLYLYLSMHHLNLVNLLLCLSICFIYIIVIIFLIRGNELFCGLREFLSQFAYVFIYSALLCRYIMKWLSTRILSKRTKQLTSLLIYFLLIFIQIPIGILWWYFTIPRICQQQPIDEHTKFKFHFSKQISSIQPCSFQCIVDYRFYATYTYTILELFLCTIISICLFVCRHCHQDQNEEDQLIPINNNHNKFLRFFNMFAFILIDITWLIWTFIYYFTHPYFVFPSLVIGMFTIGTICLLFILIPQVYFYSKTSMNDIDIPQTIVFSNKLTYIEDIKDNDLLSDEQFTDQFNQNKQQKLSNGSELSYELATSGTFLPITKTPKGPFKVINKDKAISTEKINKLIYDKHSNTVKITNNYDQSIINENEINTPVNHRINQKEQEQLKSSLVSLQRQSTPTNKTCDSINPIVRREHHYQPNSKIQPSASSIYYSSRTPPHYDETLIPILCSSQRSQTSTPVKMRVLLKSSSSVPITRRIYSNNDRQYIRHPYHHIFPPPTTSPITALYYSSGIQPDDFCIDPYRSISSYSGDNLGQSILSSSHGYPYINRRFYMDTRSLSQRLWDIDSGDDEDEIQENIRSTRGYITPMKERLKDFHSSHIENDDRTMLHIGDDGDKKENPYNKKTPVHK
ncbi:unnamed protein product [Rotaria sordida]|uniref:G-protein coupled receptors family 3 profile domain-containing protein n=1 Tax=Rotaria sordida TaxID=392033 RepID=A0A818UQN4_9BILA|nr:unnamed protein product [Rotaria sordida]CAF1032784.1 unnamed protein product [Rotaria sordida]CAF3669626.1 unnamed protein product [Rotaria sordida]CAF3701755.1 unnamed protein product [Rotaria sordida]